MAELSDKARKKLEEPMDVLSKKYLGQDEYPWRDPSETRVKVLGEPTAVPG